MMWGWRTKSRSPVCGLDTCKAPVKASNASRWGPAAGGTQRGLSSLTLGSLPAGMPALLWLVPFPVPIPSRGPRPAQDSSFHVRSGEAAGSRLSAALRGAEPAVLVRARDGGWTAHSSPRREAAPSRPALAGVTDLPSLFKGLLFCSLLGMRNESPPVVPPSSQRGEN